MVFNLENTTFKAEYGIIIRQSIINEPIPIDPITKVIIEIPLCEKKLWQKYRRLVWKITEKQNLRKLKDYNKRAFTGYHLDHKVSIWYGYKNKLDPQLIGSIDNLEFIPHRDNMRKGRRSNFKNTKCLQSVLFY
jgi:hypothetical protein